MSWSAFDLFRKNPEQFRERYFYGKEGFQSDKMAFGKAFAKAMEVGEETGDSDVDFPAQFMPKYPEREFEMRANLNSSCVVLGKFDGYAPKTKATVATIGEYKTGTSLWNQNRVDKCEQLTWYAMCHYLAKKAIPAIRLHWYHTGTKQIKSFYTTRNLRQVMKIAGEAIGVWEQIKKMSQEEYSKITKP